MATGIAEHWLRKLLRVRATGKARTRLHQPGRQSYPRFTISLLLVVLGFSILCTWVLWQAHLATEARAVEAATSIVNSLVTNIEHNVERLNLSLESAVSTANLPELATLSPDIRRRMLFGRSWARDLTSILIADETGRIIMDSSQQTLPQVNLSNCDFFQIHMDHAFLGLFISRPFVSPIDGRQMIAFSRRISHGDGSFGGIVVGAMLQDYFEDTFKAATLGRDSTVTLARIDGTVLMRWPYQEGFIGSSIKLKGSALFDHFPRTASGHFQSIAVSDGVKRLFVYTQVGALPLVIVVGQSVSSIFSPWRQQALVIGSLAGVLCAVTVLLVGLLRRELRQRSAAEKKLAVLATTDELTGLANRRHFNSTLASEWHRAMRNHYPVALLMVDADNFKLYNDKHGHQAGDEYLQTIAAAICRQTRRASDVAARYGGDEFAILLPDTSLGDAAELAKRLREDGLLHSTPADSIQLSIGVACLVPRLGASQHDLIAAADTALYRAKQLGRNRIELAEIDAGCLAPDPMEIAASY